MKIDIFHSPARIPLIVGIIAMALLVFIIVSSPAKLVYDEPYHIDLAKNVLSSGWYAALTSLQNQSAAGPLYPAVQAALSGLTGFQPPLIRWVNLLCLAMVIITLAKTYQRELVSWDLIPALSIISVPFLWPCVGMALTELPALAVFTFYVFALMKVLRNPDLTIGSAAWAGIAGLALGVSILGRQTYLVALASVILLFIISPKKWAFWLLCLVVAIFSCGWLFILWGGLVPPSQHHVNSGIRLEYGLQSLGYVAAATFFLNPKWLKLETPRAVLSVVIMGIVLTWLAHDYSRPPSKTLLLKVLGTPCGLIVGFLFRGILTSVAIVWLRNTLVMAWNERGEPVRTFLYVTLFALVAAPMKVSHLFSSRYVVGLLGVLILVVGVPTASTYSLAMRIALGSIVGAATLYTYFY